MVSVDNLLGQLTLEEKISLLAGANFWETNPIPRLGIPALKVSDGPNGARGENLSGSGPTAACFPAAVAVAATFDHNIARRIGKALAEETKSKGASVILGPTVCPHRSPRGGRNFESFSEDPLLAGNLATQLIEGVQEQGVGATIKHFAANETETMRHFLNVNVDERTLREIYMKPFEIAIKAAKPWGVMTSYSLVNGIHADLSEHLLRRVLRNEWKFQGLVMSDWGGTNSVGASITAGLDLEMPGPAVQRKPALIKAELDSGKLKLESIDDAARNVLNLIRTAGKFENPEIPPEQSIILAEHSRLIREAGSQGIVLLKNENNILPISKQKTKTIAALGFAKECLAHGGGSAMVNCHYRVTPWDALKTLFKDSIEIRYAKGAQTLRSLPDWTANVFDLLGKPGFTLSKFESHDFTSSPTSVQNIPSATFNTMSDRTPAVKFEAEFRPTSTGKHYIAINGLGPTKLYIDDELALSLETCNDVMGVLFGGTEDETKQHQFEAGKSYKIRLESVTPPTTVGDGLGSILDGLLATRLCFIDQHEFEEDLLSGAVEAAEGVDVVLVFAGNPSVWETEGRDQNDMNLPASGSQDRLISAVAAVNPNVVVINSTGSPITMPWLPQVPAVVQSWFGGQEAGNSIIDVLFGDVNPGGKLPVSFPKTEEDSAAFGNFPGNLETNQVHYKEGIFMGYRHFDKHPEKLAFPFGFGLSYTSFEIRDVEVQQVDPKVVVVKAQIQNTGSRDGSEVVQVYISSPIKTVPVAVKQLVAYEKIAIAAGDKKGVELEISADKLSYWDVESEKWVVEEGEYAILVGNSSTDVKEVGKFVVDGTWTFDP